MAPDEIADLVAELRAEIDAGLALLDTVERDALDPLVRALYDQVRSGWEALGALTVEDAPARDPARMGVRRPYRSVGK